MVGLKKYQKDSLDALEIFLKRVNDISDIKKAYEESTLANLGLRGVYNDKVFENDIYKNIPYICLRLPTGGGKTYLASCSVPLVCREFLGRDFLLVIWLVPTTAILEQTYNCLNDPSHPYRRILDDEFDSNVNIIKIDDALNISKSDLESNVNILISTNQSFKDKSAEGRRVYRENGTLMVHFTDNNIKKGKDLQLYEGTQKPIPSLVNLININNPLIIIDEAHNARTDLTFETLEKLNPSCIVEFTATPKTKGQDRSNVLYRVTAATLKLENMIKMPIVLLVTKDWQTTIYDAVRKQNELEKCALEEKEKTNEYIRPIVLIQAQHDSEIESTINTEIIKNYLVNDLKIPPEQVAIATGDERGIEGKNLNEENEPIRFIITKQALKEGWDCPFAYVFCSVANVSSSKDVEQLLGRVLRLPKVIKKENDELNKAYAFVSSENFYKTAHNLTDSLIQGGFDAGEASKLIEISDAQIGIGEEFFGQLTSTLSEVPAVKDIPKELREKIEIDKSKNTLTIKDKLTEKEKKSLIDSVESEEDKQIIKLLVDKINNVNRKLDSPQKRGEKIEVPQLVIDFYGEERIFDEEYLLLPEWNLAECNSSLSDKEFPVIVEAGKEGIIDIDEKGRPVIHHSVKEIQMELSNLVVSKDMDRQSLIVWLVQQCQNDVVLHSQSVVFISKIIDNLEKERGLKIEQMVFKRMILRKAIKDKIEGLIVEAKKTGFQSYFNFITNEKVTDEIAKLKIGNNFVFPDFYPADKIYDGLHIFKKHYYDVVGYMNGEEEECALIIDSNPNVKYWVRNIERKEEASFWLQTSTDKFYPDFIAILNNDIIVLIEYKSERDYTNDDSKEKRMIGNYYDSISDGKCRFLMTNGKEWDKINDELKI